MDYMVIAVSAFLASALTFFSGFGLGTLLLPVFVLFFPLPVAIALTALVHFLNNLFKLSLIGKHAERGMVLKFGLPAMGGAFLGSELLLSLAQMTPLFSYPFAGKQMDVTPIKLTIGILMIVFAFLEIYDFAKQIVVKTPQLIFGGILSGFFGGLSGHQGAFRSLFLLRSGLDKEAFIATGVVIACLVDSVRLLIYGGKFHWAEVQSERMLLLIAILSAFLGAYCGRRFLTKVTFGFLRWSVAVFLLAIGIGLASGAL